MKNRIKYFPILLFTLFLNHLSWSQHLTPPPLRTSKLIKNVSKMPIYQGKTVVYYLFVGDTIVNFTGKEKRAIPDLVYHHNQTKIAFLCCFFTTFGNTRWVKSKCIIAATVGTINSVCYLPTPDIFANIALTSSDTLFTSLSCSIKRSFGVW